MNSPLLSIVISVRNGETFLGECLDSILAQTLPDFECLIVDDRSTDSSPAILAAYASRDPRIIVLHAPGSGLPAALNFAIHQARAELIVRMDADDVMVPNRLERQLAFMQAHPELAVSASYAILTDARGRTIGQSIQSVDIPAGLRLRQPRLFVEIIQPAAIFRKTDVLAVGGYREDLPYTEDRELWGRIVTSGRLIAVQPEALIRYRLHGITLTTGNLWRNDLLCELTDRNILRRIDGLPELTYEDILAEKRARPLLRRLREDASRLGRTRYKAATRDYASRRWLRLIGNATLAVLFQPTFLLPRLKKLFH